MSKAFSEVSAGCIRCVSTFWMVGDSGRKGVVRGNQRGEQLKKVKTGTVALRTQRKIKFYFEVEQCQCRSIKDLWFRACH